jgi:glycosyltransferase involved in cell wall biosynthesis
MKGAMVGRSRELRGFEHEPLAGHPVAGSDGRDSRRASISLVIPVHDERENVLALYEALTDALLALRDEHEILWVDDGSTDGTTEILCELARREKSNKVIVLRRNFGQTAAMMAGIDHARGDIIIPLDGDGQNDPADIPRLLDKLSEGYDVVSGWRRERRDGRRRAWLSRAANALISRVSGVPLHDYGCSLKAYRRDVLTEVRLYGEMHRFIPIYASWQGARVAEIPVTHHPRLRGRSKYGLDRIFKVALDLMVVQFLGRYETKPIYVFGGFGLLTWLVAAAAAVYAVFLKYWGDTTFIQTPLPLIAVISFNTGVMSVLMGFLAELLMRTYFESQHKVPYAVKGAINVETST